MYSSTLSATDARRQFFDLLKRVAEDHRVYRIQHRKGAAVLMSEEDYESLRETMELHLIPGFRASMKRSVAQMKRGETLSLDAMLQDGA